MAPGIAEAQESEPDAGASATYTADIGVNLRGGHDREIGQTGEIDLSAW